MSPHFQPDLGNRLHEHRSLRMGVTIVERAVDRGDTDGSIEALDQLALEVTEHERLEEELIGRITGSSNAPASARSPARHRPARMSGDDRRARRGSRPRR